MKTVPRWRLVSTLVAASLLAPGLSWAQQTGLASQSLRGYWHVFIAYALAWVLVFGWLVSVFRRLGRLDRDLNGH